MEKQEEEMSITEYHNTIYKKIEKMVSNHTKAEVQSLMRNIEETYGFKLDFIIINRAPKEEDSTKPISTNKNIYKVVLLEIGPTKLQVVKAVKEHCGLGLKEAKDLVDLVDTNKDGIIIQSSLINIDAIVLRNHLIEAGATEVEIVSQNT